MKKTPLYLAIAFFCLIGWAEAQTLNLPPRQTNAPTGSQFVTIINSMSQATRENWILGQVELGNIPSWMRNLVPITVTNADANNTLHTLTYYVTPDYLAIGSDQDYFLEPTTPILAQRLANLLHCSLPTRLMVNQIWTNAPVKLNPYPITPTNNNNATVAVFALQDNAVMAQRNAVTNTYPLGTLVSGDKKDEIISILIYTNFAQSSVTNVVVIYGWMYPSGSPIQPEYNGHSESYMDYSHGIRMAQMAVILDGATNSITNILSSPVLWPLLSDEGVIAKPYYTIDNTLAPFFINQPYSQTVKSGANVIFTNNAFGDLPLSYIWKLNGTPISGATNAAFSITNAQAANAGTYSLIVSNIYGYMTNVPAVLKVTTNAFPLLFSDPLNADTSANWNFFAGSDDNILDYTTNWGFNFGAVSYTWNGTTYMIPPAPNTTNGTTLGVRFTVNDSNGVNAAVNIYPRNKSFSNNFALKFDMWLNYPGGANGVNGTGTTEFAICGINHLGTEINWATTNAAPTDGLWFGVDGEGGSTRDYRAYQGNPAGTNLDLMGSASGLVSNIHTAPVFQTLFPATRFETAGAPGKNWVAGEIDQTNGMLIWKLDGTIVAQRTNSSPFTGGNIMLGYMDIFPSIASPLSDAYLLFANVRVEDWTSPPIPLVNIISQPQNQTAATGSNVTFTVAVSGNAPTYQWSFNGTYISGATNAALQLTSVTTNNSGSYSVAVANLAGTVTSATAQLSVTPIPVQFTAIAVANNQLRLTFTAPLGSQYILETSTNLLTWTPVTSLIVTSNPTTYLQTNAVLSQPHFYKLVPP